VTLIFVSSLVFIFIKFKLNRKLGAKTPDEYQDHSILFLKTRDE